MGIKAVIFTVFSILAITYLVISTYLDQSPIKLHSVSLDVKNVIHGVQHGRNEDVMITIVLDNEEGIVRFTSSVLRQYHNIPSKHIYILQKPPYVFDKETLRHWYGDKVTIFPVGSISEILQYFMKSTYKIITIISSDAIFSKDSRSFLLRNMNQTDGYLSLYHSSFMHNYTYDCEDLNGTLCIGDTNSELGVALTKDFVQNAINKKFEELEDLNWARLADEKNIRLFYPKKSQIMKIAQKNQNNGNNYCGENDVAYRFSRCDFPDWVRDGIEFYFDRCTNPKEIYEPEYSIEKINRERRFWVRPVISYSFYGSHYRYTRTAMQNAARVFGIYPGWKIWIYTDYSVPDEVMNKMCEFDTRFIDMTGTNIVSKMSWRFLVASEPVKMFAVRDIDSWLLMRGKAAVDEWISSGRMFHAMRDHKNHARQPFNGGMWGGRYNAVPNMKELLDARFMTNKFMQDMKFLNQVIWPIANKSVWVHDSHSLHKFGEDHPFPTELKNPRDFVGRVAIY